MKIILSDTTAPANWGADALLSSNGEGFGIHLQPGEDRLERIQQAARRISLLGVPEVSLSSSGWSM